MNRLLLIFGIVLLNVTAFAEPAADTVTIPLDQIWAYEMWGLKSVFDLEPEQSAERLAVLSADEQREVIAGRLSIPIALALCADSSPRWPREGQRSGPAFAVSGEGHNALSAAYQIMVKGEKPRRTFSEGERVSLVFFMYQFGAYAQILSVERLGNRIEVKYRFVKPHAQIQAAHYALIPLDRLPAGRYEVEMIQQPTGRELDDGEFGDGQIGTEVSTTDVSWARRFISDSFSFEVQSKLH